MAVFVLYYIDLYDQLVIFIKDNVKNKKHAPIST